jgi:hypothetical protein
VPDEPRPISVKLFVQLKMVLGIAKPVKMMGDVGLLAHNI